MRPHGDLQKSSFPLHNEIKKTELATRYEKLFHAYYHWTQVV